MLDADTKKRIDTARDILVGKVPDPKSQVEQITIALIYKFMDDMDAESEEFGGERKFFGGDFNRYGWAKLMRSGLGGHETLNLYAEAITKMPENPGIPLLFRDIFNNAYLPYRDPETLRAFLKVIDEFIYDHSERLGDAFEYLLSVLGSQGEAGQFRTPRHIIDFIVEVIDPKKNETVLDPACGTAGFLISSYKHILKKNSDKDGNSTLTPDDRGRLANNFKGYDISPDMVRLSLVNMYLHGFADPHIYEYDTLTSQDRWNEYADIILANPPFMSPKGGIKPHNRFSVQSKRSEVLFVDYMAEHLSPSGRAGIIVPEGIIFQSQTAYRQLRKKLMEESLVAVVSLPPGVFNPYAGVKTSILILDKSLAKQADSIVFFVIKNDGYSLGAQRRPVDENDLVQASIEIGESLRRLRDKDATESFRLSLGQVVTKQRIVQGNDYSLNGERYRVSRSVDSKWPIVTFSDAPFEIIDGDRGLNYPRKADFSSVGHCVFLNTKNVRPDGFNFDSVNFITKEKDESLRKGKLRRGDVVLTTRGTVGNTGYYDGTVPFDHIRINSGMLIFRPDGNRLSGSFLFHCFQSQSFREQRDSIISGSAQPQLPIRSLKHLTIPLPPTDAQKEIVAEIEGYQKVIDGARVVVENYRPYIHINPDWPKRQLGSLAENLDSRRVPITKGERKKGQFPYYGASGIVDHVADYIFDEDILLISEDGANLLARSTPIAFSVSGKCWVNNHAHVLKFESHATQKFVEVYLNSISIEAFVTGAAQPKLNQQALNRIPIPIPDDIATQQTIAAEIEVEQGLLNANRELIDRFEKKIQANMARVWGEN